MITITQAIELLRTGAAKFEPNDDNPLTEGELVILLERLKTLEDAEAAKKLPENVIEATFVSEFDDAYTVRTACKVNLDTHEVFDIQEADIEGFDSCNGEYVEFYGESHRVGAKESLSDYWY